MDIETEIITFLGSLDRPVGFYTMREALGVSEIALTEALADLEEEGSVKFTHTKWKIGYELDLDYCG